VDVQLVRAWLELSRACAALGAQLGLPGDADPAQLVEPVPGAPRADDVSAMARAAATRRPIVVQAATRLEEARAVLLLERARRVPDLAVSGGYKRTSGVDTGVLAVAIPLPVGDRNLPAIARAEGEERAAAIELEAITREARIEVEAELRAAAALSERAAALETTLIEPAALARRAARSAFREGSGDTLRLVDAERAFIDASRDGLDLRLEAVLAGIAARLSLGEQVP
jgi:cobalt-zinc-cadmium efflux system outer membrane protein